MNAAGRRLVAEAQERPASSGDLLGVRKRQRPELRVHLAVGDWLDAVLPPSTIWHHSPNGGYRDKGEARLFKRMGTRPGWPDIEIVMPGGRVVYLEIKPETGGVLSGAQEGIRWHFERHETPYAVVRSIDEAKAALARFGVETRESRS